MKSHSFMRGVTLGMLAGATMGIAVYGGMGSSRAKRYIKRPVGKAVKAVSDAVTDAVDNITHNMGF